MIHKKYRAVVIKGPKYRLIVKSSRGIDDVTNPFTPQYPVGTRGTIQYQSSASWGLFFFVPYKQDQKKWERDQQKKTRQLY